MAWSSDRCDQGDEAVEGLKSGQVIAVPTGTLYGFACRASFVHVIVTTLVYFCFLELFMIVEKIDEGSIAISLLFSCLLGLLSLLGSTIFGFVWIYALAQFVCVGACVRVFRMLISDIMVERHPMLSIIIAALEGCGAALCCVAWPLFLSDFILALVIKRVVDTPPPLSFSPPPPPPPPPPPSTPATITLSHLQQTVGKLEICIEGKEG